MERTQIEVRQVTPAYWTATFNHPPVNIFGAAMLAELRTLVARLEDDPQVRVIVFDSADPDFFIAHYDMSGEHATGAPLPPGPTGMPPYIDTLARLSRVPVATMASIRGRARGAGSEFVLACDMRFASRERAVLAQFEVGVGAVPGGGPMARLPRLVGRGRALEVLLGADDVDGDTAERYGYVNRAVPDAELDGFVDRLARRLAGFEKQAVAEVKRFVDIASLPPDAELGPALDAFHASLGWPAAQSRIAALAATGLQSRSDTELRLGAHVALYTRDEARAGSR
jgi:enoyl-CoA hydratase/carnithine racemase